MTLTTFGDPLLLLRKCTRSILKIFTMSIDLLQVPLLVIITLKINCCYES
jgi:hypothetical protein